MASDTEMVNQINELLKGYTLWQSYVNKTIGLISKEAMDKGWGRGLFDRHSEKIDDNNDMLGVVPKIKAILMFSDNGENGVATAAPHPIEEMTKNARPLINVIDGKGSAEDGWWLGYGHHTHNAWQQYQTTLSERVNSLNQDSQVRMNEINNKDKERNRHFDQANNALQKMNDVLQGILRAG